MKFLSIVLLLTLAACTESETETSSTTRYESGNSAPQVSTGTSDEYRPRALPPIINTTTSSVRASERDPGFIFVAPPKKAQIKIGKQVSFTAHMGFCSQLKDSAQWYEALAGKKKLAREKTEEIQSLEKEIASLKIKIEEARAQNRTNEMNELQQKIDRSESNLKYARKALSGHEDRIKYFTDLVQDLENIFNKDYSYGKVEWISDWQNNIETLKAANPSYEFSNDLNQTEIKVKMSARGFEKFPAHKMIRGFESFYGAEETEDGRLSLDFLPYGMENFAWVSAYAACPLNKPAEYGLTGQEIIIDLEFEFKSF